MNTLKVKTIGQTVAEDYRTAQVFRSFGLDFCCGGNRTLQEACDARGVDPEEVQSALAAIGKDGEKEENYNEWPPEFLIDYIVQTHHRFIRSKIPEIEFYAKKVARVHGTNHPELNEIRELFLELKEEIMDHLDKEEQILFPYIRKLARADREGQSLADQPRFGMVANPVSMMEAEHEEAGEIMERIRMLSYRFTPPENACATYTVFFKALEGFQQDLHKHVHLENNILFPKALQLEKQLERGS